MPASALLGGVSPVMLAAQHIRLAVAEERTRRGVDVNAHGFGGRAGCRSAGPSIVIIFARRAGANVPPDGPSILKRSNP